MPDWVSTIPLNQGLSILPSTSLLYYKKSVCTKDLRLPNVDNHSYTSIMIYKREGRRDIERKSQRQNLKYLSNDAESCPSREMQKHVKHYFPFNSSCFLSKFDFL